MAKDPAAMGENGGCDGLPFVCRDGDAVNLYAKGGPSFNDRSIRIYNSQLKPRGLAERKREDV
jgi:hypothetical protein